MCTVRQQHFIDVLGDHQFSSGESTVQDGLSPPLLPRPLCLSYLLSFWYVQIMVANPLMIWDRTLDTDSIFTVWGDIALLRLTIPTQDQRDSDGTQPTHGFRGLRVKSLSLQRIN